MVKYSSNRLGFLIDSSYINKTKIKSIYYLASNIMISLLRVINLVIALPAKGL